MRSDQFLYVADVCSANRPAPVLEFGHQQQYAPSLSGTQGGSDVFWALSENLTERPLLRNFLRPLNREEPTLVTAIRLAGDTEEGTGLGEMRREQGYDLTGLVMENDWTKVWRFPGYRVY